MTPRQRLLQSTLCLTLLLRRLELGVSFLQRSHLCSIHSESTRQGLTLLVVSEPTNPEAIVPKKPKKPKRKKARAPSVPQTWRVFGINVSPDDLHSTTTSRKLNKDIPVDKRYLERTVLEALNQRLRLKLDDPETGLPSELSDVRVVRRSLDARKKRRAGEASGPLYNYVLDVDVRAGANLNLKQQPGRLELIPDKRVESPKEVSRSSERKPRVVIVGAGPAGLFCALTLARSGAVAPIVLERGQPVESRGKHIGQLVHRRQLHPESNFVFGEGGAGTWSDGKLTTRIGRNSDAVRFVLETLVQYGAPESILVDGSPHLGTDNLVRLLRNMRQDLRNLGGEIRFGAKMTNLIIKDGTTKGVKVSYNEAIERGTDEAGLNYDDWETDIMGDAVVIATGHSARDVYEELYAAGVQLEAKGFAAGFRVEHPQKLINEIQYGHAWGPSVVTEKGSTDEANLEYFKSKRPHPGRLPVPSYRLATDRADDGEIKRGAYSFCMCPGGQIVPSSTDDDEVCVNGMSFSRRDSLWANSALVVTVSPDDRVLDPYRKEHGVLAGIAFQRDMERRAAKMGGGNFTVPVQRLTDFVAGRASTSAPSSSYRLGVKPGACHEIYPGPMTAALRDAIANHFEKKMPGFLCDDGLLHGVETRTSSPVRISRDSESFQAIGTSGLYPAGEGAGFAGGIVSAAVDGMAVADALLDVYGLLPESRSTWKGTKGVGFSY